MVSQVAPAGSSCAIHPETPADATCERCGNFMCRACSQQGTSAKCPTCRALDGNSFPFSRTNFNLSDIFSYAYQTFQREAAMLILVGLIVLAGQFAANIISSILQQIMSAIGRGVGGDTGGALGLGLGSLLSLPLTFAATGVLTMGSIRVYLDVLLGKRADIARMFSQLDKLVQYIIQTLVYSFAIGGALLIAEGTVIVVSLVIGGASFSGGPDRVMDSMNPVGIAFLILGSTVVLLALLLAASWVFLAPMELVYSNCSGIEALQRGWKLCENNRLLVIGYLLVAGLVTTLSMMLCCLPVLAGIPFGQLLLVSLFLALRKGSELPQVAQESAT
jgi:hypothetical protein